jgi:uncharacterized protein (TIGR00255 family)
MIRSMTGYGRAEGSYKGRSLVVELRSVNHRYCDVIVRLPKYLASVEETVKKKVQGRFARGHIELSIGLNGSVSTPKRFKLDLESAGAYYQVLKKLKRALRLPGEIDLALLSHFKEMITVIEPIERIEPLTRFLDKVLNRAMLALEKMRREEGRALARDLSARLDRLSKMLELIKAREKEVVHTYHQRLQIRAAELSNGITIDPARLAQEVAIFADRSDISEEAARLKTHLEQFQKMLQKEEEVGRALDFLLQEMNREVNTIGSKASDVAISMQVVAMKSELEKIREQVQNIE